MESSSNRILFIHAAPLVQQVLANPPSIVALEVLDCRVERSRILEVLQRKGRKVNFRSVVGTAKDITEALGPGASIIHYSGHGDQTTICLEDDHARVKLLTVESLRGLLVASRTARGTKCVVVSACHSENIGKAFLDVGVPNVVAIRHNERVLDSVGQMFAESFYGVLLEDKSITISRAFEMALERVGIDRPDANAKDSFLLLQSEDVDDSNPFAAAPAGRYVDETISSCVTCHRSCPPNFTDRGVPMQSVFSFFTISKLQSYNLAVVITGERGIGKSALANSCADYMSERNVFDYIFHIPFSESLENGQLHPDSDPSALFAFMRESMGTYGADISSFEELKDILNGLRQFPCLRDGSAGGGNGGSVAGGGAAAAAAAAGGGVISAKQREPRVLFVLDGCDEFLRSQAPAVVEDLASVTATISIDGMLFPATTSQRGARREVKKGSQLVKMVNQILQLGGAKTSFLVTTSVSVQFEQNIERTVTLAGLPDRSIALLLLRSFHRPWMSGELGLPDPVHALATSRVVAELKGNPGALMRFLRSDTVRTTGLFNANAELFVAEASRAYAYVTQPRDSWVPRGADGDLKSAPLQAGGAAAAAAAVAARNPDDSMLQEMWLSACAHSHRENAALAATGSGRAAGMADTDSAEISKVIRSLEQLLFGSVLSSAFHDSYPQLGGDLSDGRVAWTNRRDWNWNESGAKFMRHVIDKCRAAVDGVEVHDLDAVMISLEGFNSFKQWLLPLLPVFRSFSLELTSMIRPKEINGITLNDESAQRLAAPIITGFILTNEAERLLLSCAAPGVFMIRFRDSSCSTIAISYTEAQRSKKTVRYRVTHTVVDVDQQGRFTLEQEGERTTYESLRYLLVRAAKLETLYPNTPKALVIKWLERFT